LSPTNWNPLKHGWVRRVADWPHSSFHEYVRQGIYPQDWGGDGVMDFGGGE
jgi:putative transposase